MIRSSLLVLIEICPVQVIVLVRVKMLIQILVSVVKVMVALCYFYIVSLYYKHSNKIRPFFFSFMMLLLFSFAVLQIV